ncbi:MAG TPA: hypothetical protein VH482_23885 [Thermomicrobiales bacterium]|jgi:hypothetical protein
MIRIRVATMVAVIVAVFAGVRVDGAAAQSSASAEQQLADKYAPIAYLKNQTKECDKKGEAYFPAPVESVLGNPAIALKQATTDSSATDPVVKMGPTAQDLAGKDDTYYLDFPGNPRDPGCTYEKDFKALVAQNNLQPTTYAHIVPDPVHDQLFLQYWFYYYFNDWNNGHETDWEMIQLVFAGTDPQAALAATPIKVGFAQHGGGESSDWTDDKLGKEGDQVDVHPSAGSHGTYYGFANYIGWGEGGTGFGCDHTTEPATRVPLNVVLVPNEPDANGPFAWLLYGGRWGQREKSEWNGPKGPNLGKKWGEPHEAMADWRTSSLTVPASKTIGPNATDFFCGVAAAGSKIVARFISTPWLLVTAFVAILAFFIGLFVVKRQELGEAFGTYFGHFRTFLGIGAFTIPIGIFYNALAILVSENPPMEWVIKWFNDTAGARLTAAAIVGGFQQLSMILLIAPPVIQAVKDLRAGQQISIRRSFREGYRHIVSLALALAIVAVVLLVLVLVILGVPVAIWLAVRWQFFGQAIILDDAPSGAQAIARSSRAVTGRWWHALGDSILWQLFALIPGPLVGALLMILGKATVEWANAFSSIVYAITVPISVIGLTFAYLRYQHRQALVQSAPAPDLPAGAPEAAPA